MVVPSYFFERCRVIVIVQQPIVTLPLRTNANSRSG